MASKTSFRYDIAFLRALAILAVVGYHLQVPVFPGPSALMQYIYDVYLPDHHQKIDKVILSADYAGYSKERVEAYIDRIEQYSKDISLQIDINLLIRRF